MKQVVPPGCGEAAELLDTLWPLHSTPQGGFGQYLHTVMDPFAMSPNPSGQGHGEHTAQLWLALGPSTGPKVWLANKQNG